MTDLPDAETAWREWFPVDEKSPRPGEREAFLAGLDAANAEREALKQEVADRVGDLVTLQRQLDAALARNAELQEAHKFMSTQFRTMQKEKEHGWQEAEKWEARAERLRAELDNLRETLAHKIETRTYRAEYPDYDGGFVSGLEVAAAIVRGSDDEEKP